MPALDENTALRDFHFTEHGRAVMLKLSQLPQLLQLEVIVKGE